MAIAANRELRIQIEDELASSFVDVPSVSVAVLSMRFSSGKTLVDEIEMTEIQRQLLGRA